MVFSLLESVIEYGLMRGIEYAFWRHPMLLKANKKGNIIRHNIYAKEHLAPLCRFSGRRWRLAPGGSTGKAKFGWRRNAGNWMIAPRLLSVAQATDC